MSEPVADTTWQQLTLFAPDFPVSPTPSSASDAAATTSATSGLNSDELFASLDRDGSWLKMSAGFYQPNLDGSLAAFCEIWPTSGTMRNGRAYQPVSLVRLIDGIASGSSPTPRWTTPTARDWKDTPGMATSAGDRSRLDQLPRQVYEAERQRRAWTGDPNPVLTGNLNPTWVEWLMGFPPEWSVCASLATALSPRSPNG